MRLRTAIKIMRLLEEPRRRNYRPTPLWKPPTIWHARDICRRKWRDRRVPLIPGDDELTERFGIIMSFLGDAFISDPVERDKFKEKLWSELGR